MFLAKSAMGDETGLQIEAIQWDKSVSTGAMPVKHSATNAVCWYVQGEGQRHGAQNTNRLPLGRD